MLPTIIVVAGPPGSGKSSIFPVSKFGTPYLNADDRAAELNGGSYLAIPKHIRQIVNQEFESFVSDCIDKGERYLFTASLLVFRCGRWRIGEAKQPLSMPV